MQLPNLKELAKLFKNNHIKYTKNLHDFGTHCKLTVYTE